MLVRRSRHRQWMRMLSRRINELIELAHQIDPEAEAKVLEPFEDEDAVLELESDEIYDLMLERTTQIWWDDGFDITVLVHEKKPVALKEE